MRSGCSPTKCDSAVTWNLALPPWLFRLQNEPWIYEGRKGLEFLNNDAGTMRNLIKVTQLLTNNFLFETRLASS